MQKMFNRLLGEDIKIHYLLDKNIAFILSDLTQFEQILMNLMINARDALSREGKQASDKQIFVETGSSPETGSKKMVRITIRDNGVGMDPEVREKIFEPFFTTKENGIGLGLSTVCGIIKHNNAKITVTSEIGSGSAFTILWPQTERRGDKDPQQPEDKRFIGTEHILLVEDDPSVRLFTSQTSAP